eukprot:s1762_g5.t1
MASFPLPALQKLQAEVSASEPGDGQDMDGDGQGTGRSRSTSVGSSQKSLGNEPGLPGVWVNPPDAPGLDSLDAACSSGAKETAWKGYSYEGSEGYMVHGAFGAYGPKMSDVFGLGLDRLDHGLDPVGQGPQLPVPFPAKATTFDDFLSPTGSQHSEASPVAPPGLTLHPLEPLDPLDQLDPLDFDDGLEAPCGDMGQMQKALWQALEEPMAEMAPITPGAVAYTPPATWPPRSGLNPIPSVGSANHGSGQCKPCAFYHTKGCQCGAMCTFCHLCLPGEKKRRQKEKQQAAKAKAKIRDLN